MLDLLGLRGSEEVARAVGTNARTRSRDDDDFTFESVHDVF